MNKLVNIIKKNPSFSIFIFLIAIVAIFFRTYNYFGRVNIHADNAWEMQVARYAYDNLKIPQVGPFSSAGPFFYGPWYFWIFGVLTIIPLGFLTHWYLMTLLSFIFIYLIFWIGREVGGTWVGVISALFAAISPAAVDNSFAVWSPALIPTLVALSLVLLIKFSKTKRFLDIFLLSFVVGLSISIHFQSVLVSPILFAAILLSFLPGDRNPELDSGSRSVHPRGELSRGQAHPGGGHFLQYLFLTFLGFIIPFLPLIWWDAHHNWYDGISLAVYLLVDQYKIWVPNRWLTYIGSYWPQTWVEIIGGSKYIGMLIIGFLGVFGLFRLKNWQKYSAFYLVAITFLFEVVLFRYYRGERFYYYSLFAHPSVIVLSAFAVVELFKFNKYLGVVLGLIIVILTVKTSVSHLQSGQITISEINSAKEEIYVVYPGKNFDIYGCIFNGSRVSHPVALSMYVDGRNKLDGVKIGTCEALDGSIEWHELETHEYDTSEVGSDSSEVKIATPAFDNVTTEHVYKGLEEWFLEKPPGKGDFWKFIRDNFRKS